MACVALPLTFLERACVCRSSYATSCFNSCDIKNITKKLLKNKM